MWQNGLRSSSDELLLQRGPPPPPSMGLSADRGGAYPEDAPQGMPLRRRSPAKALSEEEKDRRTLQDLQGQEKALLRMCDTLQKQADALKGSLQELKRNKRRVITPMEEAKVEELQLKHRLLDENSQALKTLRHLRFELEVAIAGKKLDSLVSKTKEKITEVSGMDPAQVLRDIKQEEERLLEQEIILEEALERELHNEKNGKEQENEAGAQPFPSPPLPFFVSSHATGSAPKPPPPHTNTLRRR